MLFLGSKIIVPGKTTGCTNLFMGQKCNWLSHGSSMDRVLEMLITGPFSPPSVKLDEMESGHEWNQAYACGDKEMGFKIGYSIFFIT